ncbi:MAG: 3-dehydroquinate synthase [Desulfobacterales bacterium]
MKTYTIAGASGTSTILVGERLQNLTAHLPAGKAVIITDHNVECHYAERFPPAPIIALAPGEAAKSLATVETIYTRLLELEADRTHVIVGIGGGVVCDIAGFTAATFMRGLRCGYVASTLLAQVDASVGGKNGVNLGGYKNLVGTFSQPRFVICDPALLQTLPEKEVLCGLAEVVKHAVIRDADLFGFLEQNGGRIQELEAGAVERMVSDSVAIKSAIVNQDEKEGGLRRLLNFGHTFGHAIEHLVRLSHGEAVSIGMAIAVDISARKGLLKTSTALRIKQLLARLKLPLRCPADPAAMIAAVRKDKKRESDGVHFVLLRDIGEAVVEKITLAELQRLIVETI